MSEAGNEILLDAGDPLAALAGRPRGALTTKERTMPLKSDDFRKLALTLPEATESAHMGHPDFRVRGKIFATLGYPGDAWGMVKLTPEQQRIFIEAEPKMFAPIKGAWGRQGATQVNLAAAKKTALRSALALAWRNTAPKRLAAELQEGTS
jgi:hypothetical protein